jgi:peptidoglycan hydrolase CwlO-like protein
MFTLASMNKTSLGISVILVAGTLLLASIATPSAYADKNCVNCKNRIGGNQDNSESTTNNVDNSVNNVDNSVNNVDNSVTTTCRDVTGNNAACNG